MRPKDVNLKYDWIKMQSDMTKQGVLNKSKKPMMANFYKISRRKSNILIVDEKPKGGKWSYDQENRKKIPRPTII